MTASYPVFKRRLYRICRTAMSPASDISSSPLGDLIIVQADLLSDCTDPHSLSSQLYDSRSLRQALRRLLGAYQLPKLLFFSGTQHKLSTLLGHRKHPSIFSSKCHYYLRDTTLGGLLGGWLNFLQADSPQVFETTYWSQALVFGVCAAWVGVFVVLGTDKPDYLRRFAVGIVCGFAGAVVLNTAEKTVGIGGGEQVPLTKNQQIEAPLKQALDEAVKEGSVFEREVLDNAVDDGSQERKIGQFEHTIITVVSVVSALRSPDANSEGYSISVNLLNAIERWGESYPDTALGSLDRVRKDPRFSSSLIHLIDAHVRRLRDLQHKLPAGDALPASSPTTNRQQSSSQPVRIAAESAFSARHAQRDVKWLPSIYDDATILVSCEETPLL